MPKLYGNSTVLRQNRNATRFGVEPIRLTGRMDSADTGSKQHIVAPLRSVPIIYEPAAIPKPILTVITPWPQPARSPVCAQKFTKKVNASFRRITDRAGDAAVVDGRRSPIGGASTPQWVSGSGRVDPPLRPSPAIWAAAPSVCCARSLCDQFAASASASSAARQP